MTLRRFLPAAAALACLLFWNSPGHAQAPGAAQAPAPEPIGLGLGDAEIRLYLPLIDQLSYTTHPFFQITGDPGYQNGNATGGTLFSFGPRETDEEELFLLRLFHALPPFAIEGVRPVDLPFPRGVGYGFDFIPLIQTDADAGSSGATVLPIRMDAFFHSLALRFYFFNPNEPGINYFVGLGLGAIEGTIKAEPFAGVDPEFIAMAQFPVGTTRLGLEGRGENWGFRYELIVLNADSVRLQSSNPYPSSSQRDIDFSGSIVRLALFVQF